MLGQNHWSNLSVKIVGRICRSNLLVESAGQIAGRNVARYIRNVARYANARDQMQPILGPPLASLDARMDAPTD